MQKGTSNGTATNANGEFVLYVPESAKTLTISYVGYDTQDAAIVANMKVVLKESAIK